MDVPLPRAGGAGGILLKPATYEKLRAAAEEARLVPDPQQFETLARPGGKRMFRLRPQGDTSISTSPAGGGGSTPGPFEPTVSVAPPPESEEEPAEPPPVEYEVTVTPGVLASYFGTEVEVTGLDTAHPAVAEDLVYLEMELNSYGTTILSVDVIVGPAWTLWPQRAEFANNPYPGIWAQSKGWIPLGRVEVDSEGAATIAAPWKSGNMVLLTAGINGKLAYIMAPGN
jgi:hypothetical protein